MLPFQLPLEEQLLLLEQKLVRRFHIRRDGWLLLLGVRRTLVLVEFNGARLRWTFLLRLFPITIFGYIQRRFNYYGR